MGGFFKKLISKRSLLGTVFLVILIGEPTVGQKTGIFTPPGIVTFSFLYLSLFHLFDAIIFRYKLVMYQVIFLTFAIYAVLVTGFLNKELTEYALQPNPFITLIRIQASFFAAYAFYVLNKIFPRIEEKVMSLKQAWIFFAIFVAIISFSNAWGIPMVFFTFQTVPWLSIFFILLACIATAIALQKRESPILYENKVFLYIIYFCVIMGAIPTLATFLILLPVMIISGLYILLNKRARMHPL